MNDIYSFYNSILNIGNADRQDIIKKTVLKQRAKLLEYADCLDGFCIYIAAQIEEDLRQLGITTYYVDLNELADVDHVSLIAEYMVDDEVQRILIDPTFEQFVKKDDKKLLKLKEWPSEKIENKDLVMNLRVDGCCIIDNEKFNDYVNSFCPVKQQISLNEYLLDRRIKSI